MKATKLIPREVSRLIDAMRQMYLPHADCRDLLRKLVYILLGSRIAFVKSTFKDMGKFVEFAEFPSRKGSVSTAADSGGILVIFL